MRTARAALIGVALWTALGRVALAVGAETARSIGGEVALPASTTVVYRASKIGSFESLGVTMVACRHDDPVPRAIALDFRDPAGKQVDVFGRSFQLGVEPRHKVLFVTDRLHFQHREVVDVRLGHLSRGTLRVLSDARRIKCMGRIRLDPGVNAPSKLRGIGLAREGVVVPPAPDPW